MENPHRKRLRKLREHKMARLGARRAVRAYRDRLDEVERYCMFLGFPRSGSSLVGQLLNAHRHVVISHEIDGLRHLDEGSTRDQLFGMILARDRRFCAQGMNGAGGYDFAVDGQWQGRTERLRVIGDKKAGATTKRLGDSPRALAELRATIGLPLRIVNVVRNPFDNIATMSSRTGRDIESSTKQYFEMADTIARVRGDLEPEETHEIHLEDLIDDARGQLTRLCQFLDIDAPDDYLEACARLVFPSPRRTRDSQSWTPELIDETETKAEAFSFLSQYSFA